MNKVEESSRAPAPRTLCFLSTDLVWPAAFQYSFHTFHSQNCNSESDPSFFKFLLIGYLIREIRKVTGTRVSGLWPNHFLKVWAPQCSLTCDWVLTCVFLGTADILPKVKIDEILCCSPLPCSWFKGWLVGMWKPSPQQMSLSPK